MVPFAAFSLKVELLTNIFRKAKRIGPNSSQWIAAPQKKFQKLGMCQILCFRNRKVSKYKRMLAKADKALENDLDLVKLLKRLRLFSFSAQVLLNWRQRQVITEMGKKLTLWDDEEVARRKDDPDIHLMQRHKFVDRRLLRLHKILGVQFEI